MKKIILNSTIKIVSRSEASLENPNINIVNFVLTDDKPNGNGVGIKREDFISFAQSAVFMPIKMVAGKISDHFGSRPIGAITEAEVNDNRVLGSGVVWPEENPGDVALLRDKTNKGEAQISWEIAYEDDEIDEEGIVWLQGPKLLAATLVKNPAYEGRTPMTSFSSNHEISEENNMNEEENVETPEVLETPEVVEPEVLETPEVETEPEIEEEVEEPETEEEPEIEEEVEEEESPELLALQAELEELRRFKRFTERSKIVTDTLGELKESDLKVMVELTDSQLKVVKKLVSSKKQDASLNILPNIPIVEEEKDAKSILKRALSVENKSEDR